MQRELASMLHQKSRLAALGLAVSKINHDLRNLLASAQLFSDQLVARARPEGAALRAQADARARARHRLLPIDAVLRRRAGAAARAQDDRRRAVDRGGARGARSCLDVPIRWIVSVERGLTVEADHDQLFRVLVNVARNAVQALETRGQRDPARDQIRITGRREGSVVVHRGLRHRAGRVGKGARPHVPGLSGLARAGGTGLGLAIAAELVRAHGGEIRLVPGTIGATFRITIPDRAVDLEFPPRRGERARA